MQKWNSRFFKANFCSKTVATRFAAFVFSQHLFESIAPSLIDVKQKFSQKWRLEFSKPNFCSKTMDTQFDVFVVCSTSFVCFWSIIFSEMKFGVSKVKFCSFCNPSTWWKILNHIFWQSGGFWILKSLELENTNFTRFVSFPFVEKLPNSNLFWQNFEAFMSSKDYKDKLCSFCKLLVWWKSTQIFLLTKLMTFENPRIWKSKLCSFFHLQVRWKTTQNFFW